MLFGDEFLGFFGDGLDDTIDDAVVDELVVVVGGTLGDTLGDTVGDELDLVRAFISSRIFSYNMRHFSTLRTP